MEADDGLKRYLGSNPDGYKLGKYGTILTPGKFEGEGLEAPYFYGLGCAGCADIDDGDVYGFKLSDEERALLETEERYFYITESDSGFIFTDYGSDPDADINPNRADPLDEVSAERDAEIMADVLTESTRPEWRRMEGHAGCVPTGFACPECRALNLPSRPEVR